MVLGTVYPVLEKSLLRNDQHKPSVAQVPHNHRLFISGGSKISGITDKEHQILFGGGMQWQIHDFLEGTPTREGHQPII